MRQDFNLRPPAPRGGHLCPVIHFKANNLRVLMALIYKNRTSELAKLRRKIITDGIERTSESGEEWCND